MRILLAFAATALLAGSPWTPEDYARTAWPGAARLSSAGLLAYELDTPGPRGTLHRVWTVPLARGGPRPAAKYLPATRAPRFSPSGRLALLGGKDPDGPLQVYVEGRRVTRFARGVQDLEWRDERHLVLTAEPGPPDAEDARVADGDVVPLALWELDLASGRTRRVSQGPDRAVRFAVSPDGRYVAAVHELGTRWEYDQKVAPRTRVWDLADGSCQDVTPGPRECSDLAWARDSRAFYASYRKTVHPYLSQAGVQAATRTSLPGWATEPLPLAWERGLGPVLQPLDGRLLVTLEDGLHRRAAFLPLAGGAPQTLVDAPTGTPEQVVADPAGRMGAALLSRADRPPQWYQVDLSGGGLKVLRALTRLNPHLEAKAMARVEPIRLAGLEGLLYYPAGYRPGRPWPLVLNPHGGPALHDRDEWNENDHHPAQLHAQAGAFFLKLNYSGSTGYGQAFAERLMGHYLEPELRELKAAVTELVDRGLADPGRLGITGWSNGAILAAALATDFPYPLRAIALGAGSVNEVSDWGNCQFGEAFDHYYLGSSLVEDPDGYWRRSILPRLGAVRAATLVLHGERDREVPTEQSWETYRFLQQCGKVPVRLVLFPGEGHEFASAPHLRRRLEEEMAWFRTYLHEAR